MIDWPVVAAFIGPLIAAIGLATGWFAWLGKRREERARVLTREIVSGLEANQLLMQQRIAQVELAMEKQSTTLGRAMEAIARIEGRLAGPVSVEVGRSASSHT